MRKIFISLYFVISFVSCTKEITSVKDRVVYLTLNAEQVTETKTILNKDEQNALWHRTDRLGVIACDNNTHNATESYFNIFSVYKPSQLSYNLKTASFKGPVTLGDAPDYTLYGIYPYIPWLSSSDISHCVIKLPALQYPNNSTWDPSCDYLIMKPITGITSSNADKPLSISFNRAFGLLSIKPKGTLLDLYGNETVSSISIKSSGVPMSGEFSADIKQFDGLTPTTKIIDSIKLDYSTKSIRLSDINAVFVINPNYYPSIHIVIRTDKHTISFNRTNLEVKAGAMVNASLSLKDSDVVVSSNNSVLKKNPSSLKILTFGHSYTVDSYEYLDDLINETGISDIVLARYYEGNCSLDSYLKYAKSSQNVRGKSQNIQYFEYKGTGDYSLSYPSIIDALEKYDWDCIVFQTSITEAGFYEKVITPLTELIDYVKKICKAKHGKEPIIGWHMFWAFGSQLPSLQTTYMGNQELNYWSHVNVSKQLMEKNIVQLVIPTGTTVQTLRNSILNNSYCSNSIAYELTRDGFHLDVGVGRYVAACTWFETFIKPSFGLSIKDLSFTPKGFNAVPVTSSNLSLLKKAVISSYNNPYNINDINPLSQFEINSPIEPFNTQSHQCQNLEVKW